MATELTDLEILEISLVDKPANRRRILAMKQAGQSETTIKVPQLMLPHVEKAAKPFKGEEKLDSIFKEEVPNLSDEAKNQIRVALRALMSVDGELQGTDLADMVRQLASMASFADPSMIGGGEEPAAAAEGEDLPTEKPVEQQEEEEQVISEEDEELVTQAEDELEKEEDEEEVAMSTKKAAKAGTGALAQLQKMVKNQSEALAKAQGQISDLSKSLQAEKVKTAANEAAQRLRKCIDKADDFSLVGKADDLGSLLMQVEDKCGDEVAKQLEDTLAQAHALIEQGATFKELGTSMTTVSGGAWSKIETLAKSLASKNGITQAEAVDEIMKTDEGSRLYAEYTNGQQ